MGPLALVVVIVRSLRYATPAAEAMLTAMVAMFVFAIVGAIAGRVASAVVEEAVRSRVAQELAPGGVDGAPSPTAKV
jgi:hypothetical protein